MTDERLTYHHYLFMAIYRLIFPAILGTGVRSVFVTLANLITSQGVDPISWARFLFSFAFSLIFVVSFLRSLRRSHYQEKHFSALLACDIFLCASMAAGFGVLGFLGPIGDGSLFANNWFMICCIALLVTFASGLLSKELVGNLERGRTLTLRLLASALCIVGLVAGVSNPLVPFVVASGLVILAIMYAFWTGSRK